MLCLACGDCCRRFSPITRDEHTPCPCIIERQGFILCGIYGTGRRPQQCRDHDYPSSVCPIGRDVLCLHDANAVAAREYEMGRVVESLKEDGTLTR